MGRGTAEKAHKFAQNSGHCVNGSYNSHFARVKNSVGELHIGKAGMVHKDKAGFVLSDKFHSFFGIGKFYLAKGGFHRNAHHRCKKSAWHSWVFMFKFRKLTNFVKRHFFSVYFHWVTSCRNSQPQLNYQQQFTIIPDFRQDFSDRLHTSFLLNQSVATKSFV